MHRHTSLVCWYRYRLKHFLNDRRGYHDLKGASKGSVLFPLREAPIRLEK